MKVNFSYDEDSRVVLSCVKSQNVSHETSSLDSLTHAQVKCMSNVTAAEEELENLDAKSTILEILNNDDRLSIKRHSFVCLC